MKFPNNDQIIDLVKKSKNILINCHISPDPDSVGSALALSYYLKKKGKKVDIVCPDTIPHELSFLPDSNLIKKISYDEVDFSKYSLFFILDSASWVRVVGKNKINPPTLLKKVVIDHHVTNTHFGDLNIIDSNISSNSELLYLIFKSWKVSIDKKISLALLTGIFGDTAVLRHKEVTPQTYKVVADLIKRGADKNLVISNLYMNLDLNLVLFMGKILNGIIFEDTHLFVHSEIDHKTFLKYSAPFGAKGLIADMFFNSINGAYFGILMVEEEKNQIEVSFRSRSEVYDVSKLAKVFGGGGHTLAAGTTIYNTQYKDAIKKIIYEAKKFAKEQKQ